MATIHLEADEPFFREWKKRKDGQQRDLVRATRLLNIVREELNSPKIPVIGVVGSKGKGTTATYIASALSTTGRVTLVTSPSIHTNRERFRFQGQIASEDEYREISRSIESAIEKLSQEDPAQKGRNSDEGYLSPTGLFTIAGTIWSHMKKADWHVAEAGIGGKSDELSLLEPEVLAVSEIFLEHTHLLGNTVEEIATDKLGAASKGTRIISALSQSNTAMEVIMARAQETRARLVIVGSVEQETQEEKGQKGERRLAEILPLLPPGLGARNAILGIRTAQAVAETRGLARLDPQRLKDGLAQIRLPGRLQAYETANGKVILDACISKEGAAAALAWCESNAGTPRLVLIGLPSDKGGDGIKEVLQGLQVMPVEIASEHLEFDTNTPWGKPVHLHEALAKRPQGTTLVLGTWSVIAQAMKELEDKTEI